MTSADGDEYVENVAGFNVRPLGYVAVIPEECNLRENWDEWIEYTNSLPNSSNIDKKWHEFYEKVGYLQMRKIVEELDRMGGAERRAKLEDILIVNVGGCPMKSCIQDEGTWELVGPSKSAW